MEGDAKAVVVCRGRSTAVEVEVGLEDHEAVSKASGGGQGSCGGTGGGGGVW